MSLLNWSTWPASSEWPSVSVHMNTAGLISVLVRMGRAFSLMCSVHLSPEYKEKIGLKCQFLIEPKPKEPCKHQYDYGEATQTWAGDYACLMCPSYLHVICLCVFRRHECYRIPSALRAGESLQVEHRAQPHHAGRTLVWAWHCHGLSVRHLHCSQTFDSISELSWLQHCDVVLIVRVIAA